MTIAKLKAKYNDCYAQHKKLCDKYNHAYVEKHNLINEIINLPQDAFTDLCISLQKPSQRLSDNPAIKSHYLLRAISNYQEEVQLFDKEFNQLSESERNRILEGLSSAALSVGAGTLGSHMLFGFAVANGVTSTGVSIASLSGAARIASALAWLGNGAKVAGGFGMAGGITVLTVTSGVIGVLGWFLLQKGIDVVCEMIEESEVEEAIEEIEEVNANITKLYNTVIKATTLASQANERIHAIMNDSDSSFEISSLCNDITLLTDFITSN